MEIRTTWLTCFRVVFVVICTGTSHISGDTSHSTCFARSTSVGEMRARSKVLCPRRSTVECALQCRKDPNCMAFYFKQPQGQCILASNDLTLEDSTLSTTWIFQRVPTENCTGSSGNPNPDTDTTSALATTDPDNNVQTFTDSDITAYITKDPTSNIHTVANSNINQAQTTTFKMSTNSIVSGRTTSGFRSVLSPADTISTMEPLQDTTDGLKIITDNESDSHLTTKGVNEELAIFVNASNATNADDSSRTISGHHPNDLFDPSTTARASASSTDGQRDTSAAHDETSTPDPRPIWYGYRNQRCHHDYVPSLRKCVSFHFDLASCVTWSEAAYRCFHNGGRLLDFRSSSDFMTFSEIINVNTTLNKHNWHVGLVWNHSDGSWRWANTGVMVSQGDKLWARGKPSLGLYGQSQGSSQQSTWTSRPASETSDFNSGPLNSGSWSTWTNISVSSHSGSWPWTQPLWSRNQQPLPWNQSPFPLWPNWPWSPLSSPQQPQPQPQPIYPTYCGCIVAANNFRVSDVHCSSLTEKNFFICQYRRQP